MVASDADRVADAWDELAKAIGCYMEGRGTMERIDRARARLAEAERIAHDEVAASSRLGSWTKRLPM